ncbi:Shedu immune nuclease family protein [Pectinatus frisingensis]|uniref:Shedu immune nuclease family protein n=1 Tax=Pectinatus frisingensis TaxID=865 RepID=UPI0018C71D7C|nr:Shedu immune nuclease family protein [Pectinatus frisingensis]
MDELIRKFKNLLDDENNNENDIQYFLEDNSELIPLPFIAGHQLHQSAIISKLPIGNGYVLDFAYLTKCSDYWYLVLMEIEDPKKTIFKKSSENIEFTSKFNNAYDQVLSWKSYLEDGNNTEEIKKRVKKLMGVGSISELPFYVRYVLVYGRKSEKQDSKRRISLLNQKNTNKIQVKTFDSLVSEYQSKPELPKMILSPWRENGFLIKKVPSKDIVM